ncbi:MAG: hypothetical protein PHU32_04595 [Candidatus ainarchaeum sp.]|nr:hypothetical protein [Candidatus ainarchaeum sp.]
MKKIIISLIIGAAIIIYDTAIIWSSFSDNLSKEGVPIICIFMWLSLGLFGLSFLSFSIIRFIALLLKK